MSAMPETTTAAPLTADREKDIRTRLLGADCRPWSTVRAADLAGVDYGIVGPDKEIVAESFAQITFTQKNSAAYERAVFLAAAPDDIEALLGEIVRLREENARLTADVNRLDWLSHAMGRAQTLTWLDIFGRFGFGVDLREAIDAAREASR